MLSFERRGEPSRAMALLSPLLAVAFTVLCGGVLFACLGKDPLAGLGVFFVEPLRGTRAFSELALRATPLVLIALGLLLSFRANVWNIGAEGQYVVGAVCAGGTALMATPETSRWFVLLVVLAGVLGGMLWAGVVALLRDRYNANEILVSLMLTYVAEQLLGYLVHGPWKDPRGYNFPQTITFLDAARLPVMIPGQRVHFGTPLSLLAAALCALFLFRSYAGFRLEVGGLSADAARYAGFSSRRALWTALLASGGLAGLAGALETAGPLAQLTPYVPVGYGFSAIIVAFVGRLHPLGVICSALLMSMFYIGGELAQSRLGLPRSLTAVFQGLLLFLLLACDTLIQYRVRLRGVRERALSDPGQGSVASRPEAGT